MCLSVYVSSSILHGALGDAAGSLWPGMQPIYSPLVSWSPLHPLGRQMLPLISPSLKELQLVLVKLRPMGGGKLPEMGGLLPS